MSEGTDDAAVEATFDKTLAMLLAMAMFVLVVDTSLMNVSISAVVHDLGTTVSSIQSAIALEALVSAAFILIGSKVGDLIGRKKAYVLGLLAYAVGALGDDARSERDPDHHLLGRDRRARCLAAVARDAIPHPRQLRRGGPEEGLRPGRCIGGDRGRGGAPARRVHHDLPVVARRLRARGRDHRGRAVGYRSRPRRALHRTPTHRCGRGRAFGARDGRPRPGDPRVAGGRGVGRGTPGRRRGRSGIVRLLARSTASARGSQR